MGNLSKEKCSNCGKVVHVSGDRPDERSRFDLSKSVFFCSRKKCKNSRGIKKSSTGATLKKYRRDLRLK